MRGRTKKQASMLAFVDPETLIPAEHPLRTIKRFADAALAELSPLFDQVYAADGQGRPSIPPERLLKASLLISLYSVRSERAFCRWWQHGTCSPGPTGRPGAIGSSDDCRCERLTRVLRTAALRLDRHHLPAAHAPPFSRVVVPQPSRIGRSSTRC
jgi:Transposase domain (DUF772)